MPIMDVFSSMDEWLSPLLVGGLLLLLLVTIILYIVLADFID